MTFATIIEDVQEITARTDLGMLPTIKRSIAEAIRNAHGIAHWERDLRIVPSAAYVYSPQGTFVETYPTRYRDMYKVFMLDSSSPDLAQELERYTYQAPQMFGLPLSQYYRVIGDGIRVNYSGMPTGFSFEYFQYPEVILGATPATDSWIAEINDTALVYFAAAKVFNAIGDDAGLRNYLTLYEQEKIELLRNHTTLD